MKWVDFSSFTEEDREKFVQGFEDADDIGVTDWDTSTPWGAPWTWCRGMYVTDSTDGTPYEWGGEWFRENKAELLELREEDFYQEVSEKYPGLLQKMGDVATAGDALRFVDFCKARDVDPLTCSESVFYECLDECFRADAV